MKSLSRYIITSFRGDQVEVTIQTIEHLLHQVEIRLRDFFGVSNVLNGKLLCCLLKYLRLSLQRESSVLPNLIQIHQ